MSDEEDLSDRAGFLSLVVIVVAIALIVVAGYIVNDRLTVESPGELFWKTSLYAAVSMLVLSYVASSSSGTRAVGLVAFALVLSVCGFAAFAASEKGTYNALQAMKTVAITFTVVVEALYMVVTRPR